MEHLTFNLPSPVKHIAAQYKVSGPQCSASLLMAMPFSWHLLQLIISSSFRRTRPSPQWGKWKKHAALALGKIALLLQ